MKRVALFLVLVMVAAGVSAAQKRKVVSKQCLDCHATAKQWKSKKVVHEPFRDDAGCETCHKRHGVVGTLVLVQEQPELCYQCHEKAAGDHVHAPLKDGKCTDCHNPHATDAKALLAQGNEACFTCRKTVHEAIFCRSTELPRMSCTARSG
jgi:predicted CXXCH cytochrome family protein